MTRSAFAVSVESLLVPIFARKSSLISGRNPSGDEEFTTGLEWFSKRLDSRKSMLVTDVDDKMCW